MINWLDENFTGYNQVRSAGVPVQQAKVLDFGSGLAASTVGGVTTITGTGSAPLYVSALVTTPPLNPSVQEFYIASAYSTPGDGGGGTFVWNATDLRPADGGTIIAVTGIATGRWNRVYWGSINPQWWGADRTGVVDSYAAFAACVACKEASTGAISIHIPAGYYKVASSLDWGARACVISGDGWGFAGLGDFVTPNLCSGTILASTVASGYGFTIADTDTTIGHVAIKIKDLAIVSPSCTFGGPPIPGTTATGLAICPSASVTPVGVQIENVYLAGWAVGFNPGAVEEGCFRDLVCWSNTVGIQIDSGPANCLWFNTQCNANRTGMKLTTAGQMQFFGGLAQSNSDRGIWLRPNSEVNECCWRGIWFENNNSAGGGFTTIAAGSNGVALSGAATIHVADSTKLSATAGTVMVATTTGYWPVTFTGTSGGNALIGCAIAAHVTGNAGNMATGGSVVQAITIDGSNTYGDICFDLGDETSGTVFEIDHAAFEQCHFGANVAYAGPIPVSFNRKSSNTNSSSYIQPIIRGSYGVPCFVALPSYAQYAVIESNQLGGTFSDASYGAAVVGNRDSIGIMDTVLSATLNLLNLASNWLIKLPSGKGMQLDNTGGLPNGIGSTGALNLPNNTGGIYFRNAAATGDIRGLEVDGSNNLRLGGNGESSIFLSGYLQLEKEGLTFVHTSTALTTGAATIAVPQAIVQVFTGTLSGDVVLTMPTTTYNAFLLDFTAVNLNGHAITVNSGNNVAWTGTINTTSVYLFHYGGTARPYMVSLPQ